MNPRVSVIIRTYNRADYLGDAIESVLAQTFRDLELIVVDDGSTDDTPAVLERYAGQLTPLFLGRIGNPATLFNAGLGAARGEFVGFLDSDDIWLPHKLEQQLARLDADQRFGFAYGNVRLLFANGRRSEPVLAPDQIVQGSVLHAMVRSMCVHTSTVIIRRRCIDAIGWFDESKATCEELFYFLRLAQATGAVCVPEPVTLVRKHPGQYSLQLEAGFLSYGAAIEALEELLHQPGIPWIVRLDAHRSIARYHAHLARTLIQAGRTSDARRHAASALRWYPLHRPAWRWALTGLTRRA